MNNGEEREGEEWQALIMKEKEEKKDRRES